MLFPSNNTPRWVIFFIDTFICIFSIVLAYLLRFNFSIPENLTYLLTINLLYLNLALIISVRIISFLFARTYAGIIRYTSSKDATRIFIVVSLGSLFFVISNLISYFFVSEFIIPFSIVIIDYMTTVFLMITFRVLVKMVYFEIKNPSRDKRNIIIYGAGDAGIIAKRTLDRDAGAKYKVLAFIDDNKTKANKKLEGVAIYESSKLVDLVSKYDVAHLIISIQNLPSVRKKEIVDTCLAYKTKVLNVPPVSTWINGSLSFKQIKKVRIEDLLGREPIKLDEEKINKQISGKVILVTGAAGSIGSEIVRQIAPYKPKKIIMLDQAESALYDLEIELGEKYPKSLFEPVIGNIRVNERMENVFRSFRPELVYHAAAYKHVPMMENNPSEAIFTNVLGTKTIADLSVKYLVKNFVMVSTDKAVNPSNVMGASKRIAEMYIQALNNKADVTSFVTTRFGNVLGSNGSVIPLFKKQIEKGGPITITHPDITRYFMTIPEACQLVLEAGAIGNGGEILIFDMGKSIKIVELAKKMIKLSGLELGKDIQITYTGLRPGEKLYEELLNNKENTIATHHPQIMKAHVAEYDFETISIRINELIGLFENQNNVAIVSKMKEIVPEFISNNSVFSELDKPKATA
ncbi:MAG: polysaccharide biosynthesis protein [Bacteroidetes bacterium]|nr:polysaccharide biosynthesis protein [Bacteroidota bacterium]HET6244580.1 nucleoside-diphosphate sugar epimerase/dehydratase [Bacteroidia bacterium]